MNAIDFNNIVEASGNIGNFWQFLTFIFVAIGFPLVTWLSKHWVTKSEALEAAKTKNRKLERDKQLNDYKNESTKKIEDLSLQIIGIGKSFDRHISEEKAKDFSIEEEFKTLNSRLQKIEMNQIERIEFKELQTSVHNIDKNMARLMGMFDDRIHRIVSPSPASNSAII